MGIGGVGRWRRVRKKREIARANGMCIYCYNRKAKENCTKCERCLNYKSIKGKKNLLKH